MLNYIAICRDKEDIKVAEDKVNNAKQEPDSTMVSISDSHCASDEVSSMSVQEEGGAAEHQKASSDVEIEELTDSFSKRLLTVTDIDAQDSDNPQLVSNYANEIYAYMRSLEV